MPDAVSERMFGPWYVRRANRNVRVRGRMVRRGLRHGAGVLEAAGMRRAWNVVRISRMRMPMQGRVHWRGVRHRSHRRVYLCLRMERVLGVVYV